MIITIELKGEVYTLEGDLQLVSFTLCFKLLRFTIV